MNNKQTVLLAFITCLIIGLVWFSVYLGKDEFEQYQSNQDEALESHGKTIENNGLTLIDLSIAEQKNSGIQTALTETYRLQKKIPTYGTVISIAPIATAQVEYNTLKSNLLQAKAGSDQRKQQYQRLKLLNDDDKNISDNALSESLAQLKLDDANVMAASSKLNQFIVNSKQQWGSSLSALIMAQTNKSYLIGLLNHQYALVQISLPLDSPQPIAGDKITIKPLGTKTNGIEAYYVDKAIQTDINFMGKTYFFSAPAQQLREGMRVNAIIPDKQSDSIQGSVISNKSVVWYASKPWVYVKTSKTQFIRTPINADTEIGEGWFDPHFKVGSEIVTTGAQLLLSEEFKYLIKNENDD
jgi:hypothetical protein